MESSYNKHFPTSSFVVAPFIHSYVYENERKRSSSKKEEKPNRFKNVLRF